MSWTFWFNIHKNPRNLSGVTPEFFTFCSTLFCQSKVYGMYQKFENLGLSEKKQTVQGPGA